MGQIYVSLILPCSANNLAQFHRSYALHDTKMCTQQELDRFYKNDDENKENQGEFHRQLSAYNDKYRKFEKFDQAQNEEQFNGQPDFDNFDTYKNIFGIESNNYGRQCCCCCDEDDTECKQDCTNEWQCYEPCRDQRCQIQSEEEEQGDQSKFTDNQK